MFFYISIYFPCFSPVLKPKSLCSVSAHVRPGTRLRRFDQHLAARMPSCHRDGRDDVSGGG